MFLGNTLSAASSGLDSIERQIAVVSQNVSNASTPNYVRETVSLTSLATAGGPAGVRTGVETRVTDSDLQASVFGSLANEAGSNATQAALAGIDQVSGVPGSGQDLSSLFGALQDSFSTLANDPASGSQQEDVLSKAGAFVSGLQTVSAALVQARQSAQNTLVTDVTAANSALQQVGQLSAQIIATKSLGQSTADLEDQRDVQLQSLAQLTGAKFVQQSNGGVEVIAGNSVLPQGQQSGPFSLAGANVNAATPAGALPSLQLNGATVGGFGGEIGANLQLRDTTVPAMQSQLDGFAQSVASAFSSQNLPLFTDPTGAVPPAGTVGFAATIQVSTAVQATPTMLRDGTGPTVAAGDTTVISNVLSNVFAGGATGLPEQATSLIAGYAEQATAAQSSATTNTALRTGLQSRLSAETGVSVDSEMAQLVQLQAAYGANAKVVTAVENMWTQLLGMMPTS